MQDVLHSVSFLLTSEHSLSCFTGNTASTKATPKRMLNFLAMMLVFWVGCKAPMPFLKLWASVIQHVSAFNS
jgi:hypothetical protein